ncbi:hypothetical protein ACHAPJ_010749 [Fusarium lateritium]
MLFEDQSLINVRHSERFKILSNLICCRKGWTELVPRQVIDFGHALGASSLRKAFALTILARKEGLVLKPDEPYFDFADQRRKFSSCCIKLKKEYIGNFGDVGDFAVVGAKYDSTKAMTYRIPGLKWTHFYVGCLDNREAVKRWDAKPEFTIVNVVELNETMLREVVTYSNPVPVTSRENDGLILNLAPGVEQGSPPTIIFTKPLVFDIKCFSFDRVGNTGFWSLRFPSVTKVHFDRDFTDTISFEQLQALAKDATTATELEDSQENLQWIAKLEGADPRGIAVDAASQLTVTTMPTPSPRKSTQNTSSSWSPTSPLATRLPAGRQLSPCRERVERARPLRIAPAPATALVSPLAETSAKHKRDSPFTKPALPRKRLKPDSESSQTSTYSSSSGNTSQPREPLGHIDGNSQSQPAMPTVAPPRPSPLSEIVSGSEDEEEAPEQSIVIDADTLHKLVPETAPELGRLKPLTKDVALAREGCSYVGDKCMLAKMEVLVSPGLLDDRIKAKHLLELHGVYDPITNIDAWLEAEKTDNHEHNNVAKIYLLCDSKKDDEIKALSAKIENVRRSIPYGERKWIEVHDWQLLNYVTTKEDNTPEPKYYDGWYDPWQRWFIGLV